jgi:hypothetical protein
VTALTPSEREAVEKAREWNTDYSSNRQYLGLVGAVGAGQSEPDADEATTLAAFACGYLSRSPEVDALREALRRVIDAAEACAKTPTDSAIYPSLDVEYGEAVDAARALLGGQT